MAGTEPHSMLSGIIIFFLCEIYALSVAVLGGSLVDILEAKFYDLGMYDINGSWGAESSWYAYNSVVNIFYLTPYIIGLLGVVILVLTIWHRHGSDREEDDQEYIRQNNL